MCIVIVFLAIVTVLSAKDLPSYFPRCYRNDPNINDCLVKATEQVRPFLIKGVPELSLLPVSPFLIPEISQESGGSGALSYKATLSNVSLYGLHTYNFSSFEFNPSSLEFKTSSIAGPLYMKGQYILQGKILQTPIVGQGTYYLNISHSTSDTDIKCKLIQKRGIDFLKTVDVTTKLYVGNVTDYEIKGLFDGNEILSNATNAVIRDNVREIIDELTPTINEVYVKLLNDVILQAISFVPYDKLFPIK